MRIVILAAFAGAHTIYGGLTAVVGSNLIQGVMLLVLARTRISTTAPSPIQ